MKMSSKSLQNAGIDTFDKLLDYYKAGNLTDRQLISYVKNSKEYTEEVIKKTSFLDDYDMYDIIERLYYLVNNLTEVVKCKYCDNKATWFKRGLKEGYRDICMYKECRSKQLTDTHIGKTIISENRNNDFIEWQNSVTEVNDAIIKENFKIDKFVHLMTNPILIDYFQNRFKDSDSFEETLKRIRLGIEEKPLCAFPGCNKPVAFIGRKRAMFATYCCPAHAAQSEEVKRHKKESNLEHWGTENVYDSSIYQRKVLEEYGVEYHWQRKDIRDKRAETLIEKYGTEYPSQVKEIMDKIQQTTFERHGFVSSFQSPEIRQKLYELEKANKKLKKSKSEDTVAEYIESLGYKVERHVRTERYPYCCDIYLPDYDLYIEYQGSQYHTSASYLGTDDDLKKLEELKAKAEKYREEHHDTRKKRNFFEDVIYVWSDLDVRKRNEAEERHINFLEIYHTGSRKFDYIKTQLKLMIAALTISRLTSFNDRLPNDEYNNHKDALIRFATKPVERRRVIQQQCKRLNKKEWQLTASDIISGYDDIEF